MNNVALIGRLAKDPELRYTGTGKAVATFTLAINRGYGQDKTADFIPIVVWEKQAENCANYLRKGSQAAVVGKIQPRSWDKSDGTKGYITEVVASSVEFISTKNDVKEDQKGSNQEQERVELEEFQTMMEDEDTPS